MALASVLFLAVAGLALGTASAGSAPSGDGHERASARADATGAAATGAGAGRERWIRRKVARMSLREKVGQLFVANFYGTSAGTEAPEDVAANQAMYGPDVRNARDLLARYRLGGLVYFRWSRNLDAPRQTARLSNGLQRAALSSRPRIPLLIATDQENGLVSRVWEPATQFPGNMALGATRDAGLARAAYRFTARELAALGINQNYAPDADVNVNPANPVIGVRSFGERPRLVSRMTAAAVRGTQRAGVVATVKHFPGHGDTVTDSHTGVPWILHDRETWNRVDAPPFEAAIAAGVDIVMTAHVVMPYLQSDCDQATQAGCDPATLDREILTGLLRRQLGFRGVIVTDALNMAGVRERYGDEHIAVMAIRAGVDMPMLIDTETDTASLEVAFRSVLDAVREGRLSERRLDRSVARILRLKLRRGLFDRPFVDPRRAARALGTAAARRAANRVGTRAATLLRDDAHALPLGPAEAGRVLVTGYSSVSDTNDARPAEHLTGALVARGYDGRYFDAGYAPDEATVASAVAQAGSADTIVLVTSNASGSTTQRALAEALLGTGKRVIVVAVRNPYDAAALPAAGTFLATYSWTRPAMVGAAKVIAGEVRPRGRLPVRIPSAGDPAATLFPFGFGLR